MANEKLDDQTQQTEAMVNLTNAMNKLNKQWFFRAHDTFWGLIWFNFLRGLFFGLGSFLGATVFVYVLLQFLANINFIPIIGEWAAEIANIITQNLGDSFQGPPE